MFACRSSNVFFKRLAGSGTIFRGNIINRFNASVAHIVGCYQTDEEEFVLTSHGKDIDSSTGNKLTQQLKISKFKGKVGKTRILYGLSENLPCVTVAGLGELDAEDETEDLDIVKENTRIGIAAAAASIQAHGYESAEVDPCSQTSAVAEGVFLSSFKFQQFKTAEDKKKKPPTYNLIESFSKNGAIRKSWQEGKIYADAQNFARILMETPSNYKYPSKFADIVADRFSNLKDIKIVVRDKVWLEEKGMHCFLSVNQGSIHPPLLLEIHYTPEGATDPPIALVGKGITFDSGGISLKPSQGMALMKGDMGGAACVLGAMEAVSRLSLPCKVVALIALSENMPSGASTKPGDVFTAMNGKTVEVDNTDAEGRLVLADALCYAHTFNPSTIINLATLTGAIDVALGAGVSGVYCNDKKLWKLLHEAGKITGDRLWRMPMYKYYSLQMDCSVTADLRNTQKKARSAGACTAAAFLKEFVELDRWAHFDIAGVMSNEGDVPYLGKGMSGRPTRTVIQALRMLAEEKNES